MLAFHTTRRSRNTKIMFTTYLGVVEWMYALDDMLGMACIMGGWLKYGTGVPCKGLCAYEIDIGW